MTGPPSFRLAASAGYLLPLLILYLQLARAQMNLAGNDQDYDADGGGGGGGGGIVYHPVSRYSAATAATVASAAVIDASGMIQRLQTLNALATVLKDQVDQARAKSDQLELVFLIDASASVGEANFRGELNFVRKLLSDFTMEPAGTRVAIVTFAGRGQIVRHVDYVSSQRAGNNEKCQLLNKQLDHIDYTGGGTYTQGALMEAFAILEKSRSNAEKIVFLVTDGFSNGGDPRYAANLLKGLGVTIFTFGIQTGNIDELRDIASEPSYAHSYFLNSFLEFETLARKALHRDLKPGTYALVYDFNDCSLLCRDKVDNKVNESSSTSCCDPIASCTCGTATGHYACMCPLGYFGSGLANSCQPCPNGTYGYRKQSTDMSVTCLPCPNVNHITTRTPAISVKDCICAPGFAGDRDTCRAITCPKLKVPENGYFVKANACNNVINAACGIRCQIGFHLSGDSIRLCSKNGSWTGEETQCLLKTCPALRAPANGRIKCEHEYEKNRSNINDKQTATQPIDTRCQFQCERGFQLRGSKVRNCLPLSRWDGLKTTCKPTFCEPLKPVANALIQPKNCMGPAKLPYSSNCTITCEKGYKLEGPRTRMCVGRHGTWSKRHSVNRCIDKTRPIINCPSNVTVPTLPGKHYTFVNWSIPNATDNSGTSCNVWSKPHITFPWKVHIGKHTVKYIAQDVSGNRARCSFVVQVVDKEAPKMENCENNQLLFTGSEKNLKEFKWDEPIFYDNSGNSVKINKTYHSSTESLTEGKNYVLFSAADKYNNYAKCMVNVTVQDACNITPKPLNGHAKCTNKKNEKQCTVHCNHGYAFALNNSDTKSLKKELNYQIVSCNLKNHLWSPAVFPDCSPIEVPKIVSQEGYFIVEGDLLDCDNTELLDNLTKYMNESYNFNVLNICKDEWECNSKSKTTCKEYVARTTRGVANSFYYSGNERYKISAMRNGKSRTEKLRNLSRKEQLEFKFTFITKIIEENQNNTRLGIALLKEKIHNLTKVGLLNLLDNETNREIGKLALNLHVVFKDPLEICDVGSVLRKNDCVKCPVGTFHNITKGQCQSCHFGEYQSKSGSPSCVKCPDKFFTKKTHAKSSADCVPVCQPGYYSRRRYHQDVSIALVPCISCEIGFYQPQYGQNQCLPCPANTITESRAATSINECLLVNRSRIDSCKDNPCFNRATCMKEKDGFSCECRDHYVGSRCEILVNPCLSSPCSNAGQCILKNDNEGLISYICLCKPGYTGVYCESWINECSYSPCRNGGTCLSTDIDLTCTCRDGFEGDFCEIAVNHCLQSPCEMNSTCRSVNGTWKCYCKPGYLGLRCNLLPCDWLPCHPNEICVNVQKENADKSDFRCECPPGFTGNYCTTRVNHCEIHPCLNNGTCKNNLLNYTCNCYAPFIGLKCEIELSSDYIMHFLRSGTTDYVIMPGSKSNLTQLTVCFWLQSIDTFNYGTVVSYATTNQDNAFTLTDYNGFVLYVNGEKVITDARMNDGYWHFICVSWENKFGSWQFYVDGIIKDNGTHLARDTIISANGMFVFGQEQDVVGGGFSESESFVGKLFLLDIWDVVLSSDTINYLYSTCEKYHGSLITWAQMQQYIHGNIQLETSSFCQGCALPVASFKGYVNISDDGLEVIYSCDSGYEFRKDYERFEILKKRCLKHGNWEGLHVPICVKVNCPYPGYFLRGRVEGRSYSYGDKISYFCNEGYILRGNQERVCKSNGKWSGVLPFCIGKTCKNLLAPNNGDIEYVLIEHDRDDLSILQVGQQLEFKCDPGYILIGQKLLTCEKNGTWDYKSPTCEIVHCPPPKYINNASVIDHRTNATLKLTELLNTSTNGNETTYTYGSIVEFSCKPGHKFKGNHKMLEKLNIQCSSNGSWTGFVPDCVPLQCPYPDLPKNSRTYLLPTDYSEANNTSDEIFKNLVLLKAESFNKSVKNNFNKTLMVGTTIKIMCDDGYASMTEQTVRNCTENETWSGNDLRCDILQCPIDNHPIISIFTNQSEEKWIKESKENISIQVNANNEDNNLLRNFLQIFDFYFEGDTYGKQVILKCKKTSQKNSSNTIKENDLELLWKCSEKGTWKFINSNTNESEIVKRILNKDRSMCHIFEKCKMPKAPLNGYIENSNTTENFNFTEETNIVNFKCHLGYNIMGPQKAYCLANRTWSSMPNCQPIICEKPLKISNAELKGGQINVGQLKLGSIIFYQCLPGYRMFGQLNAKCLNTGKWSSVTGRCTKISCGKPPINAGGSIQGSSYLYQDRLIYICPGGKFRDMIMCNQDGKWSPLPKCI